MSGQMVKINEIGMYIMMDEGIIYYCPIGLDGEPESDPDGNMEMEEMIDPRSQEVLDAINKVFNTRLTMDRYYPEEKPFYRDAAACDYFDAEDGICD